MKSTNANIYTYAFLFLLVLLVSGCANEQVKVNSINFSCHDCNVLFLNIELLRADYVGLINPEKNITQNIDTFFKNSIIFEQVSAPAGETFRSSTVVLTAMDATLIPTNTMASIIQKKVIINNSPIFVNYPSIAEILHENSFNTIFINEGIRSGKLVFLDRGFHTYIDFSSVNFINKSSNVLIKFNRNNLINKSLNYLTQTLVNIRHKPFFILYHPNTLHNNPYSYPLDRFAFVNSSIVDYRVENDRLVYDLLRFKEVDNMSYENYSEIAQMVYSQQLKYVDDELGVLFDLLTDSDFLNNTIIVFYAGHGEGLGDNNVLRHGVSYQSNIHVPLIIRHPNVNSVIRVKEPISLVDLVPTVYEMLGIDIEYNISGTSLVPLIKGEEYEKQYIYGQNDQDEYVRFGNWKLIIIGGELKELYNLKEDTHENNNLIMVYPKMAKNLEFLLENHRLKQLEFTRQINKYFETKNYQKD